MRRFSRFAGVFLALTLLFSVLSGCTAALPDVPAVTAAPMESAVSEAPDAPDAPSPAPISEDGTYTAAEDVALYLHLYGLPDAPGREYRECDIGTLHAASRGAKRLVYSNDGLIYYTEDHYESFTLLYGDE